MRIRAVFETDKKVIELIPESLDEKILLGSALSEDVHGRVHVKYEGHPSYNKAEIVSITLKEGKTQ